MARLQREYRVRCVRSQPVVLLIDPRSMPGGAVAIWRDHYLIVQTRFSKAEAEALLGKQVRTKLAIDGVPAGAVGQVMQIDEMQRGEFDLIVEWSVLVHGKRQHDWFNKDDYHQQLAEVEELSTNA